MTSRIPTPARLAALGAVTTVLGVVATAPALAADGGSGRVHVVNTETVQVYTSSTGQVDTRRVYEQLALTGHGTVDLSNPISTDHLRNLDGFGGFTVKDGKQITETTVDGEKKLRSVSNYDGALPLDVTVAYKLDGRSVKPGDVVGKDGHLEVTYTVKNTTGKPQQLTFADGKGGTVTKTVDVPIPMVGSLDVTAPPTFTHVQSEAASMGGDGKGGTKMSFTMTLFPPIGSDTAVFGYSADITDGVIPRAEISALPVNPLASPTFKSAAGSYKGGADSGVELADGATTIDTNLLKLRDGAADLLAGLIKLRDGAGQLETGLAGTAVPGARKLADGAGQLDTGLGQLDSGARTLAAGTHEAYAGSKALKSGATKLDAGLGRLGGGAGDLSTGADRLSAGQQQLAAGLKDLYDGVDALPQSVRTQLASDPSYKALLGALGSIADGVGTRSDAPTAKTLLGGINAIQYGLRNPVGYTNTDCGLALVGQSPTKCGAMDAVQFISGQLATGATDLNQLKPVLYGLNSANACPGAPTSFLPPPSSPATQCELVSTLYYALFGVSPAPAGAQAKVTAAANALDTVQQGVQSQLLAAGTGGLDQLRFGLSNPAAGDCLAAKATPSPLDDCGIKEAAVFLQTQGIPMLVDGITSSISAELKAGIGVPAAGCDPTATLRCAAAALADGGTQLTDGVDKLVAGVDKLSAGGDLLAVGAGDLSAGLGQIDGGAGRLADGAGQAKDGSAQVADGAGQLASGLKDAANGSSRLRAGLGQAADGAPKLVDGAQQLSTKGAKKLVAAGASTAQSYGEQYAVFKAGAQRATTEDMAFGAPAGATGLTAYNFVIQGEDGESGRNWTRGLGGLAILGAGGAAFAVRRRFV